MTDQPLSNTSASPSMYLILPAYNEERNIRPVLRSFSMAFRNPSDRLHVVVNNSKDNTYQQSIAEAAHDQRIIVSNIQAKVGKGGAILYGFEQAKKCTYTGFVDADGSIIPEAVERLLEAFKHDPSLDLVISSRWMAGSRLTKKQSLMRRLSSRSFNLLNRLLFGFMYHDTQCGAKIIRLEAWHKIAPHVRDRSFAFDIDLLWQAKKKALKVAEVPIPWHDTPGSSVNIMQSAWPIMASLLKIRFRND